MIEATYSEEKKFNQNNGMYEGSAPYIFISYSHRDTISMTEVCNVLRQRGGRFWYDSGLHSGDDWNMVIASHLEKASVCLLLLSREAAASEYVKNELNFAQNHRIPIHVVLIGNFELPIDIEMMIGRIQMIEKKSGYEQKLMESLPGELFDSAYEYEETSHKEIDHPLFQVGDEIANRQGTISYLGVHKSLGYELLVQADYNSNVSRKLMLNQARIAANLSHPVFPKIYDVMIKNGNMYTFQEYRGEIFLDKYLEDHKLQEMEIVTWISSVIDAMDYLFSQNLGFRDFARGSLVVTRDKKLCLTRLQNNFYGVIKLQMENRQYYFEKEVEEIAVLLYQLCTGRIPVLPFDMISSDTLSKAFVDKVNLILQKSTKEDHRIKYSVFREITADLNLRRISMGDARFLKKRKAKLKEYETIKKNNLSGVFTSSDSVVNKWNLEEQFGFESTVVLKDAALAKIPLIRIRICSTGQVLEFAKDEIVIGREQSCDMVLNQPVLSRFHAKVRRLSENEYVLEDMNASNGTCATSNGGRLQPGQKANVRKGEIILIANIELQIC